MASSSLDGFCATAVEPHEARKIEIDAKITVFNKNFFITEPLPLFHLRFCRSLFRVLSSSRLREK